MVAAASASRPNPFAFILLLGVLAAITVALVRPVSKGKGVETIEIPGVGTVELNPDHPFEKHSASDVMRVRKCLEQNGPYRTYREKDGNRTRWHLLCIEPQTGSIVDMIVEIIDGTRKEITSFFVKDGTTTWTVVEKWLMRKGATRWTSPIP